MDARYLSSVKMVEHARNRMEKYQQDVNVILPLVAYGVRSREIKVRIDWSCHLNLNSHLYPLFLPYWGLAL